MLQALQFIIQQQLLLLYRVDNPRVVRSLWITLTTIQSIRYFHHFSMLYRRTGGINERKCNFVGIYERVYDYKLYYDFILQLQYRLLTAQLEHYYRRSLSRVHWRRTVNKLSFVGEGLEMGLLWWDLLLKRQRILAAFSLESTQMLSNVESAEKPLLQRRRGLLRTATLILIRTWINFKNLGKCMKRFILYQY